MRSHNVRKRQGQSCIFRLADRTSKIDVSLWRQFTEFAQGLSPGTQILLGNVYAKRGFVCQLELITRAATKIEVLPDNEQGQAEFLFLKGPIICASQ